jgi:glycosyltransferase involved in cell wall biosynthesis
VIRLSVIVPAYNEENTVLEVLERVNAQSVDGVEFEVVVVDDGSSDGTGTLLEANPDAYNRLVRLPSNQGKGAAVKAGLAVASGDFVLFQDADLEYDPADYARLLEPVLRFDVDLVMGSRMLAPSFTRVHYFWHKQGNRLLTFIFNVLYNTTFTDIYSCYLLYRRSLLDPASLRTTGWEQHAEILCRVIAGGGAFFEVPISYNGRTYGEGKKIRARDAWPVVATIITSRVRRGGAWGRPAKDEAGETP